ncbi:hypothetical protein [Yinghuangia seranimata]|uniref:hypothetical protein n=1 Tax=Yinghuangia seranimata TaxID=408067 RepID=UPI00248B4CAD|nr:hypothetical protein [Yinghuangia seranimata]MDI2130592.1 hypothetical protein [Yinghuangia seranimata]
MTRNPPAAEPSCDHVPLGTRALCRFLGVTDPAELAPPDGSAGPVSAALARYLLGAAGEVDELDERLARDAARLAWDVAPFAEATDAHRQFSWGHLVDRVQNLAAADCYVRIRLDALHAAAQIYAGAAHSTGAPDGAPRPGPESRQPPCAPAKAATTARPGLGAVMTSALHGTTYTALGRDCTGAGPHAVLAEVIRDTARELDRLDKALLHALQYDAVELAEAASDIRHHRRATSSPEMRDRGELLRVAAAHEATRRHLARLIDAWGDLDHDAPGPTAAHAPHPAG